MIRYLLLAAVGLGAYWIVPGKLPEAAISCLDRCAAVCGLEDRSPAQLDLQQITCLRRQLSGEHVQGCGAPILLSARACPNRGDCNGDGLFDVRDLVCINELILGGQ
jgi:hypothetical protein